MKKDSGKENEFVKVCALCEYASFIEYDEKYMCKYKNRCYIVGEDDVCRHFRFDLLKINPTPKKPYKAEDLDIDIISIPASDEK